MPLLLDSSPPSSLLHCRLDTIRQLVDRLIQEAQAFEALSPDHPAAHLIATHLRRPLQHWRYGGSTPHSLESVRQALAYQRKDDV